jgi:isoleucyl-tRNA synthetase
MRADMPVAGKTASAPSFKDTLNLPKTEFPMRAGLAELEPRLLEAWSRDNLYAEQRAESAGRPLFTLHDGPPYANGHLHMGHALNKVLKDMAVRSAQMSGKDARFVPGWDCHGLPVEWKVEEQYRAKGLSKDSVPLLEFRKACRDYAAHWVDVQTAEFRRLGVNADWDHPYLTMDFENEAAVAREFMTFLMNRPRRGRGRIPRSQDNCRLGLLRGRRCRRCIRPCPGKARGLDHNSMDAAVQRGSLLRPWAFLWPLRDP